MTAEIFGRPARHDFDGADYRRAASDAQQLASSAGLMNAPGDYYHATALHADGVAFWAAIRRLAAPGFAMVIASDFLARHFPFVIPR